MISGTVDAAFAVSEAFEDDRERPKAPENESKKKKPNIKPLTNSL